jgi:hypothetical protein
MFCTTTGLSVVKLAAVARLFGVYIQAPYSDETSYKKRNTSKYKNECIPICKEKWSLILATETEAKKTIQTNL